MSKDNSFHEYIIDEVFRDIEGISSRHMFGGWGIYKNGIFFALIADGELYFKVDDNIKKIFEKMGSKPFIYKGNKKKDITLSYWQLPVDIMEDIKELKIWVEKSVGAAKRTKKR